MFRPSSSIIIALYGLFFMSCTFVDPLDFEADKDLLDSKTLSCSLEEKNEAIVSVFRNDYYFNEDVVVPVDYQVLPSSQLVQMLKVDEKENFSSWVDDAFSFDQSFGQGVSTGQFGFRPIYVEAQSGLVEDDRLTFYIIEKYSPAWNAGMRRGDTIMSIDGISKNEIFTFLKNNHDNIELINAYHYNLFGYDLDKDSLTFVWESSADSTIHEAKITRASYTTDVIEAATTIDNDDSNTGYFSYRSFSNYSEAQVVESFDEFYEEGIDNLILDFRSNTGGSVRIAQIIINRILNEYNELSNNSELMMTLEFNQSRSDENQQYRFWDDEKAMGLKEVVVLIDRSSCSASELVINSLIPYTNVTLVGDEDSCGKPYAMHPQAICEGMLFPVTSKMTNANNEADYLNGFQADCVVDDTLMYNWGDVSDPQIKEALHILNNGSCRTVPSDVVSQERFLKTPKQYFEQSTFDDYANPNTILFK